VSMNAWRNVVLVLIVGSLALGVDGLEAQERIRVTGWVQWLSGSTMQVMTPGGSVAVDLREAPQGSYSGVRPGDAVVIDGVVARDRTRVIAREVSGGLGLQAP
jgi:hypothetical protein